MTGNIRTGYTIKYNKTFHSPLSSWLITDSSSFSKLIISSFPQNRYPTPFFVIIISVQPLLVLKVSRMCLIATGTELYDTTLPGQHLSLNSLTEKKQQDGYTATQVRLFHFSIKNRVCHPCRLCYFFYLFLFPFTPPDKVISDIILW